MKKYIQFICIFILIFSLGTSKIFASSIQNMTIYFDKDKYTITEAEKQKLIKITDADLVYIDGYTDSDGSYEYNQKLSQNRAEEIKRLIVSKNPTIRTDVHFFGKTKLKKQEITEEDKKQNRRVEIAFIQNPFLQLKTDVQKFRIDNSKDQTITCKEGTVVEIPQGAFDNKMVEIEISEHYKLENILGENLTTKSDNQPLETAGMIKINAKVNGIETQPTTELTYKFPTEKTEDNFQLFLGTRDKEYEINWILDKHEQPEQEFIISGRSVATQDIAIQSEKFWNNICDKMRFYETESPAFLCFYNAHVGITINPEGYLDTIVTNYPTNSKCDKTMKRIVAQHLPKQFSFKERYLYSTIEMSFNDFLPIEIVSKNQQLLAKAKNTIDINTYADAKTNILQNAIAEQRRIEQEKELAKQQAENAKEIEAYNKYLESRNNEILTDQTGLRDYISISNGYNYNSYQTISTGWLNCDRIIVTNPRDITTFHVETNMGATIAMLSKTYRSIFPSKLINGMHRFNQIPDNQEIILVSSYKKDNQLYLAIKETNTNIKECSDLQYKPVSIQQFKQAIKDIKI